MNWLNRNSEIQLVKILGEKIGYGNIMDIASALWANKLEEDYGTTVETSGAHVPTILPLINESERDKAINRLKFRCEEVKDAISDEDF